MLNQTAEYALRAVIFLADREDHAPVPVGVISEALAVPQNYLSKVLHILARARVLDSMRGPTGGFRLRTPATELTLSDVIAHFDPLEDRCLLVRKKCSALEPCAAHHHWKSVAAGIRSFFRATTIAELIASAAAAGRPAAALLRSLPEGDAS
jgi:Rrf2 family transcriptional regulator, iron-sulfur cluster assembly transcription factor